jgi:YesN/AraC family two-component response regulator
MGTAGKLLVVDDDAGVREALAVALGTRYEVRTAASGADALDALCTSPFELVLLDYRLPDLLGTSILQVIRRFSPTTPVLVITGVDSEEVTAAALREGASGCLRKPIDTWDLHARVAALLSPSRPHPGRRHSLADPPAIPIGPADRGGAIQRVLRHMQAHLGTALSLGAAARVAGLSKYHFCRRFKASTGLSFREYLARQRIARAEELLREPGRTITVIAHDVGFKDVTHFGRVFKRLVGRRPSEVRQQALGARAAGAIGPGDDQHLT